MLDIKNKKLGHSFFYFQLLLGFFPVSVGLLILLYINYTDNLRDLEFQKIQHEQTKKELISSLHFSEQKINYLAQSQELLEYLLAPAPIKPMLENRLYGKFIEVSNQIKLKNFIFLQDEEKKNFISTDEKIKNMDNVFKREFSRSSKYYIKDKFLVIIKPIYIDDQQLSGPNADFKGEIIISIDRDMLTTRFPDIARIKSIRNAEDIETIELDFNTRQRNFKFLLAVGGITYLVLILSIYIGMMQIKKYIIVPIEQLTNEVKVKMENAPLLNSSNEIVLLENVLKAYQADLEKMHAEQIKAERAIVFEKTARQVSHDIRSPLSALNVGIGTLSNIAEENRVIIRNSIARINDIANSLLEEAKKIKRNAEKKSEENIELIPNIVESIISEKRIQYRDKIGIIIEEDLQQAYGSFAKINASDLKRALSNLINNAIEALPNKRGVVKVIVKTVEQNIEIDIIDNGKGISKDRLPMIGTEGFTYGKNDSGSGFGIFSAKEIIHKANGKISIESEEAVGTIVKISLPLEISPAWFIEKIELRPGDTVVIVDDDLSIHHLWQNRINGIYQGDQIKIVSFTSALDFKKWYVTASMEPRLYLMDFELIGQNITGIDLIEEFNVQSKSVLVSSRYEELNLSNIAFRFIPKSMAAIVPIKIIQQMQEAVLIDDDDLTRMIWESKVKGNKAKNICFS